jgi:hypothetical protein
MICRGVEANVEATFIHFDQAADCQSEVLWTKKTPLTCAALLLSLPLGNFINQYVCLQFIGCHKHLSVP